jgi:MFS family permease
VVLTLHAVTNDYASLMALRALLGVFESAISPGFSLITGMWYTPREHVSRHSIWFAGNAIASIIGTLIAYGLLSYEGSLPQWKVRYLELLDGDRSLNSLAFVPPLRPHYCRVVHRDIFLLTRLPANRPLSFAV